MNFSFYLKVTNHRRVFLADDAIENSSTHFTQLRWLLFWNAFYFSLFQNSCFLTKNLIDIIHDIIELLTNELISVKWELKCNVTTWYFLVRTTDCTLQNIWNNYYHTKKQFLFHLPIFVYYLIFFSAFFVFFSLIKKLTVTVN